MTLVIWGVVVNCSGSIFVKQVLIGRVTIDWMVIVMSLIAKIKQTTYKSGVSLSLKLR